jgi:hypothetical protein
LEGAIPGFKLKALHLLGILLLFALVVSFF